MGSLAGLLGSLPALRLRSGRALRERKLTSPSATSALALATAALAAYTFAPAATTTTTTAATTTTTTVAATI